MSRGVTTCYDFCYLWKKVTCRIASYLLGISPKMKGFF